ncbi:hypothetical protein Lgee_0454 [Legionella geestiana]|uniref:Uncharacterized protein n=1 Tax=Legionella geestiana TaxID=45065 RepID=A0A0W0U7K9_9GAMM|nr:hypothetical protein [Legionella geestiana]KTD03797.1 hypothetical protein Lgee_0454 [Legionella geestiana]QBS11917.1 hypothetical protein E4T54_03680 [Legionella geestiana]QDQ40470.1 hypothetical protein E3226_008745 [Legionella geestiana]STX53370.1 Uncharacterised protein [Legionella geestiana]
MSLPKLIHSREGGEAFAGYGSDSPFLIANDFHSDETVFAARLAEHNNPSKRRETMRQELFNEIMGNIQKSARCPGKCGA